MRASVITFSDDAKVEFYLDRYNDQRDVLNALSFLRNGGRTNTQEALRKSYDEVFTDGRCVTRCIAGWDLLSFTLIMFGT